MALQWSSEAASRKLKGSTVSSGKGQMQKSLESADNSLKHPTGRRKRTASLKDLCPDDKKRVSNLIHHLAKLGQEKSSVEKQLEKERDSFEKAVDSLMQDQRKLLTDREGIQKELAGCQSLLAQFQREVLSKQEELSATITSAFSTRRSKPAPGLNTSGISTALDSYIDNFGSTGMGEPFRDDHNMPEKEIYSSQPGFLPGNAHDQTLRSNKSWSTLSTVSRMADSTGSLFPRGTSRRDRVEAEKDQLLEEQRLLRKHLLQQEALLHEKQRILHEKQLEVDQRMRNFDAYGAFSEDGAVHVASNQAVLNQQQLHGAIAPHSTLPLPHMSQFTAPMMPHPLAHPMSTGQYARRTPSQLAPRQWSLRDNVAVPTEPQLQPSEALFSAQYRPTEQLPAATAIYSTPSQRATATNSTPSQRVSTQISTQADLQPFYQDARRPASSLGSVQSQAVQTDTHGILSDYSNLQQVSTQYAEPLQMDQFGDLPPHAFSKHRRPPSYSASESILGTAEMHITPRPNAASRSRRSPRQSAPRSLSDTGNHSFSSSQQLSGIEKENMSTSGLTESDILGEIFFMQ